MSLTLNITAGNDKKVVLWLLNGLHDDGREPFPVELSEDVAVKMVSEVGTRHAVSFVVGDEGRVLLDLKGSDYKIGLWGIEVVGRLNGAKWRAYGDSMIHYTATTERGAEQVTVAADADELTLVVGYVTAFVPKRTSELTNDGDGQSPFATEDYVGANGGKIDVIKYNGTPLEIMNKVVDIPVPATYDDTAVRELIAAETTRATTAEGNLDTTKVNKSEMTVVAGTGTNADKTTITLKDGTSATVLTQHQDISGKVDKVTGKGLSTNDFTDEEKQKIVNLEGRLATVEELATLSIEGQEIGIASASDFDNPDATKRAKIPTVGSVLDCMDVKPTPDSVKPVQSGGVFDTILELGERCQNFHSFSYIAETGQWNADGAIRPNPAPRAHLKIQAKGYRRLVLEIPNGWFANICYVDDNDRKIEQIGPSWNEGSYETTINGQYDIMLNIKYGTAGTQTITQSLLNNVYWTYNLYNNEFLPAASYQDVLDVEGRVEEFKEKVLEYLYDEFPEHNNEYISSASGNVVEREGYCWADLQFEATINVGDVIEWHGISVVNNDVGLSFFKTDGTYIIGYSAVPNIENGRRFTIGSSFTYEGEVNIKVSFEKALKDSAYVTINGNIIPIDHTPKVSTKKEVDSVLRNNLERQTMVASLSRTMIADSRVNRFFTFAHISDTHCVNKAVERAVDFLNEYQDIDLLIHTGDIQRKSFNDENISIPSGNTINYIQQYIDAVGSSDKPFLSVLGNHDNTGGGVSSKPITLQKLYERFMKPMVDKGWLSSGANIDSANYATWYYKDFATQKIRVICLNSFDALYDGYCTLKGMDDNVIRYSPSQITFLINTLLSVPSNYHVIVTMHTPYDRNTGNQATIINDDWSTTAKISAGTHGGNQNTLLNGNPVLDILAAYKDKTSLQKTYTYSDSEVQSRLGNIDVNADFSSANGVFSFIAFGHNHSDWVGEFREHSNIKCVCVPGSILTEPDGDLGRGMNGISGEMSASFKYFESRMQGRSQDAINVYVVRTDIRKVYVVRFGADFTNDARTRILTSFNY